MSTEQVENQQAEETPEQTEAAGGTELAAETSEQQAAQDELPEWARKSLDKANKEAASYRTQLRDAQEALSKAKSPEDYEALSSKLLEVERQLVIRDNTEGIPSEVVNAEWVNWPTDAEGIKKTAESLRAFVARQASQDDATPREGGSLQGGLNPSTSGTAVDLDPASLARKTRHFRNRR